MLLVVALVEGEGDALLFPSMEGVSESRRFPVFGRFGGDSLPCFRRGNGAVVGRRGRPSGTSSSKMVSSFASFSISSSSASWDEIGLSCCVGTAASLRLALWLAEGFGIEDSG